MTPPVRIGNCSGFYGDRHSAMREMLTGGDLDYLTGDYLAELTMLILGPRPGEVPRPRLRQDLPDPARGVPRPGARQGRADRRQRGRAEPGGPGRRGARAGRAARPRAPTSPTSRATTCWPGPTNSGSGTPLTANAYLGAWGIVDCLGSRRRRRRHRPGDRRVGDRRARPPPTSAGAATDYDALAGAVAAGHVIECGAQATGGNYAFFTDGRRPDLTPGFPLAEIHADGSSVITKHAGTGGAGQRRHRHRAAALRDHRRAVREPRRDGADGQRRAVARTAPTASGSAACGASRRRRRSRCR